MDIRDLQLATQWWDALYQWYETGEKKRIVELLKQGAPMSRDESRLLAEFVSGEWKRPKRFGDRDGFSTQIIAEFRREYYVRGVKKEQDRLKAERKPGRQRGDIYKDAIEAFARNGRPFGGQGGHSASSIEKLLRPPEAQYKKTSASALEAYQADVARILAKLDK